MSFVPPAATLLQASADYLEDELLPTLAGYHRFQTRIALNVLRTVQRELALAATHDAEERRELAALLGHGGELADLRRALAARLDGGELPLDDPALVGLLRQTLRNALSIDSPGWDRPDDTPDR
jgi:hypothetical protein